jgi:CPA1 family monovalent cation:H+ antiporter
VVSSDRRLKPAPACCTCLKAKGGGLDVRRNDLYTAFHDRDRSGHRGATIGGSIYRRPGGLLLGLLRVFQPPQLTKDLLYTVFLPGLLFEAAFHINFEQFWRNKLTIFSLAVLLVSQVTKQINDPMIEITLTTIAAYGAFVAAEHFHYSGVIATVTAGMVAGNYGARVGMSPSTRLAIESFWEYIAFALNSIVFLLIGFQVHISDLVASWQMILAAYLSVTLGRALVIFGVSSIFRISRERIPWSWSTVLTWGGLRGALPMVLALSLPANFAHRDLLVTMTFGVVMISILLHGVTASPLLKLLGIVSGHEARETYEFLQAKLQAANAVLADIERLGRGRFKDDSVLSDLQREYETIIRRGEEQLGSLRIDRKQLRKEEMQRAKRQWLLVERRHLL